MIGEEIARRVHERVPDKVLILPVQWLGAWFDDRPGMSTSITFVGDMPIRTGDTNAAASTNAVLPSLEVLDLAATGLGVSVGRLLNRVSTLESLASLDLTGAAVGGRRRWRPAGHARRARRRGAVSQHVLSGRNPPYAT